MASLWCLLTKSVDARQGGTCKRPLVLCPSSLVQNWGKVRRDAWGGRQPHLHFHLVTQSNILEWVHEHWFHAKRASKLF